MRPRLALALPLLVAGCGTTTVDTKKGEQFITKTVEDQVGARVKSVRCPDDIKAKTGDTFTCTVTGTDGTTGDVRVTQRDDKGRVSVSAPFVHVRNLETLMAGDIQKQVGAKVQLTCPEIIVGKRGDRFDCDAVSGEDKAVVKVTQTDDKGNVNYKLQQR